MTLPTSWRYRWRRTIAVRALPAATTLLLAIGSAGSAAASTPETNKAGPATGTFLVRNGQAASAIVIGGQGGPFHGWVAGELQRYLRSLSGGELPIVVHGKAPPHKALIVLGGPQANPLCAAAQQRQMVNLAGLKPEGFVLKTVELDGRPAVIIGANDETGTMYAAYELLERLGVVFQLTGDIIPQRRPDLALPALDVRMEPVLKYRGMHCCHGLRWHMGLADFRKHIDQLAKLKLNCLQFYAGIGSPWVEFSYAGKAAEILYPKESGYTAWGFGLSTSGTAKEVRIGRECFPQEYLGPPEFAHVQTQQEAYAAARNFLHEIIRYAHQRKVQVWLMMGEIPYVPPNLVPADAKRSHDFYCGVAIPIGNPAVSGIWEAAVRSMVDTYPEADAYGIWTSELFLPVEDAQTQELLRRHAAIRGQIPALEEIRRQGNVQPSRPEHLDCDLAQICVAADLVKRIRRDHPAAKLGVSVLFRPYLFRALDSLLPKDVWLMSMETWANTAPVMHFYGDVAGRELLVMPRIDDDGCELHMQLNATMYDHDEIIAGSARHKVAGIVGQLNKERGLECNVRYLAEGAWNPDIKCRSFYEGYLRRLCGTDALETLLRAYLMLEENDKALGWHGRRGIFPGYCRFSPCRLRTDVNYEEARPKVNRQQLEQEINAAAGARTFWQGRATQCRQASDLLRAARAKVLSGSRAELDYVIFKTETFILYFELLDAFEEARAALDRAWLAKAAGNTTEFGSHLAQCKAALDRAEGLSARAARQMVAYCTEPTEKYLLFRYNQNVIGSIEAAQAFLNQCLAVVQVSASEPAPRIVSIEGRFGKADVDVNRSTVVGLYLRSPEGMGAQSLLAHRGAKPWAQGAYTYVIGRDGARYESRLSAPEKVEVEPQEGRNTLRLGGIKLSSDKGDVVAIEDWMLGAPGDGSQLVWRIERRWQRDFTSACAGSPGLFFGFNARQAANSVTSTIWYDPARLEARPDDLYRLQRMPGRISENHLVTVRDRDTWAIYKLWTNWREPCDLRLDVRGGHLYRRGSYALLSEAGAVSTNAAVVNHRQGQTEEITLKLSPTDKYATGYQLAICLPDKKTEAALKDFYASVFNGGAVNDQRNYDFGNETDGWYYAGSCWMYGMALAAGVPADGALAAHPYNAASAFREHLGHVFATLDGKGRAHFGYNQSGEWVDDNLHTILGTRAYLLHSGDLAFVRRHLPAMERMLAYFIQRQDAQGLFKLDSVGAHWYYDAITTSGTNGYYNAFFYKAACDLAEMEAAAGHAEKAAGYRRLAEEISTAFNRVLWRDNLPGGPRYLNWIDTKGNEVAYFCDLCQWPPIAVGIASPEQARKIVATADARIRELEKEHGYQGFAGLSALWPVPASLNPHKWQTFGRYMNGGSLLCQTYWEIVARARASDTEGAARRLKLFARRAAETFWAGDNAANIRGEMANGDGEPYLADMVVATAAVVHGILGFTPTWDRLEVIPQLPPDWPRAEADVLYKGRRHHLTVEGGKAHVQSAGSGFGDNGAIPPEPCCATVPSCRAGF